MKRFTILAATLAVAVSVLVAPSPAQAAVPWDGSTVQVINKLPSDWPVKDAVKALDVYTGSRMQVVSKCSANVRRCITIKNGRIKQARAGWSKDSTITIDVYKTKNTKGWKGYYGYYTKRWLLVHELAHQRYLWAHLNDCKQVMDERHRCGSPRHVPPLVFNAKQKKHLAGY